MWPDRRGSKARNSERYRALPDRDRRSDEAILGDDEMTG